MAIERGDGPVVEELMDAGLAVFVVPPRQIKALRTRYGSAGNKDDRFDAYVLADTLRTDGHRWRPLREDSDETKALRALCRSRKDLVEARVAVINQLRSNLELAFPGGIGLFAKPDSAITLAFLSRFPTASSAAWLSPKRLANWLQSVGYTGGVGAESLYNRMAGAAPGLVGAEGDARGQITSCLVAAVATFNAQIVVIEAGIADIFARHPDQHIFASLPRYWDGPGGRPARRDRRLSGAVPDRRARSLPSRALAPRRASPANTSMRSSAGRATRSSVLRSWTSPPAAAPATRGPLTFTSERLTGDVVTPTPSESSPEPGCGSSGAAGRTGMPSIPPSTELVSRLLLDIGHSYVKRRL